MQVQIGANHIFAIHDEAGLSQTPHPIDIVIICDRFFDEREREDGRSHVFYELVIKVPVILLRIQSFEHVYNFVLVAVLVVDVQAHLVYHCLALQNFPATEVALVVSVKRLF